MEEDGDGEEGSAAPFWVQTPTTLRRSDRLFFSSALVLFLLLLLIAVFFLVFVAPSTFSFSANIFRPTSVKRSWDSFNIVLVLAAVVFGFLSRNRNHDFQPPFSLVKESESQKSNPPTQNKWFDYSANDEQKLNQWGEYGDYQAETEFEHTHYSDGDYQKRFLDDFCVDSGMDPWQLHHRRRRSLEQVDYLSPPPQAETVVVDTLLCESTEGVDFPAALSSTPPLPELPIASPAGEEEVAEKVLSESMEARKEKSGRFSKDSELPNPISPPKPPQKEFTPPEFQESRSGRAARKKERSSRRRNKDIEPTNPIGSPPPQPPPAPPPPQQQKSSKREDKRGGGKGNSTKDFLNSLYHKKKKKQRQKSVDNVDSNSLLHEAQLPLSFQIAPPSPPPPPPPSVFHNLFSSKKQKRKRAITVTLEQRPPSPPPAPPRAAAREPEPTSQAAPLPNHKPPIPIKINTSDRLDEASNSGGESPLNRLPPPPPPMPPPPSFLKNPAWKSAVQGDYSSRSGSPDSSVASHGGDVAAFHQSPLFCPSPDVNTKAEDFITNFRAKLNLEKIHSTKKRQLGPSNLGPAPN